STTLCVALATLLPGCSDDAPQPPPRTLAPSPTEGVDSAALGALLVEHWDISVARDPFWGTWIGEHRVDRDLAPVGRADIAALTDRRRALLAQVTALDTG